MERMSRPDVPGTNVRPGTRLLQSEESVPELPIISNEALRLVGPYISAVPAGGNCYHVQAGQSSAHSADSYERSQALMPLMIKTRLVWSVGPRVGEGFPIHIHGTVRYPVLV